MGWKSWILAGLIGVLGASAPAQADAGPRTHEFRVTGMSCALCPARIKKGLQALEGVREVEVDRGAERVRVVAAESLEPAKLEATIEDAGHFQAELLAAP